MHIELHRGDIVTKYCLFLQIDFYKINNIRLLCDWVDGPKSTKNGLLIHVPNLYPADVCSRHECLAILLEIDAIYLSHRDKIFVQSIMTMHKNLLINSFTLIIAQIVYGKLVFGDYC